MSPARCRPRGAPRCIARPSLSPAGEPASQVSLCGDRAGVETQKLVRQDDAEGFGILRLHEIRLFGTCASSLTAVSHRSLSKKNRRGFEPGFPKMQIAIDQGPLRIDVEEGRPGQHARLLPAGEPMARRNEAQRPAQLVQGGSRQALDLRLAVIALRALRHDQQVVLGPKVVSERFASNELDGVRLVSHSCRDVATRNVRWAN